MAGNLVRVNLTLDRTIYQRLKKVSALRQKSVSQLTREILQTAMDAELGSEDEPVDLPTRIRRLRAQLPLMRDSVEVIRESRAEGWR